MAMKRSFYTVNGEIIGEGTSGGEINYATDALGSVTGTLVGSALVNTYGYKPYGALLVKTGGGADPTGRWIGNAGYRATGRRGCEYYAVGRSYSSAVGSWTTVSSDWLSQAPYAYLGANATSYVARGFGPPSTNRGGGALSQADIQRLAELFNTVQESQGIEAAKHAVLVALAGLGITGSAAVALLGTIMAAAIIAAGALAVVDLARYIATGKKGVFTGCGLSDWYEDSVYGEQYMDVDQREHVSRYRTPRNRDEAKKQVEKLCKKEGGYPGKCGFAQQEWVEASKNRRKREWMCLQAWRRKWAYADCINARRQQDRLCPERPGHPRPPGGADTGHATVETQETKGMNRCRKAMQRLHCGEFGFN